MKTVLGVFETVKGAEYACDKLLDQGFGQKGVTLINRNKITTHTAEGRQEAPAGEQISDLAPQIRLDALRDNLVAAGVLAEKVSFCAELVKYGSQLVVVQEDEEQAAEALNILHQVKARNVVS